MLWFRTTGEAVQRDSLTLPGVLRAAFRALAPAGDHRVWRAAAAGFLGLAVLALAPDWGSAGNPAAGQRVMPSAASKSTCCRGRGRSPLHTRPAVAASGHWSTRT